MNDTVVSVGDLNRQGVLSIYNGNTSPDTSATMCRHDDNFTLPECMGAEGIVLTPSCGAQFFTGICRPSAQPPSGVDPDVLQIDPAATGISGACTGTNFTVVKVAGNELGKYRFDPPPGSHVVLPGPTDGCTIAFTYDVLKMPTIDLRLGVAGVQTAQVGEATEQSSSGNLGAGQGSASLTVVRSAPYITTYASPDVVLGNSLFDQATVSGLVNPVAGATVTFRAYGPNDADCATAVFTDTVTMTLNGPSGTAQSANYTPAAPGVYRWIASYNGDANNVPVSGACGESTETRTVMKPTPAIATVASPDVALGAGVLSDQATVTGLVAASPGATVTFRLYGPDDANCAAAPAFTTVATLVLNGSETAGTAQSASFTPTAAGVYRWRATFDGDANNNLVTGLCGLESETRLVAPPAASPPAAPPPAAAPPATPPPATPPPLPPLPPPPAGPIACTPAPGPAPTGGSLCPRGTARISGPSACQRVRFRVRVRGAQIARVVFSLDGRRLSTLRSPNSAGSYSVLIDARRVTRRSHRVQAAITFRVRSTTRPRTLRHTFTRCRSTARAIV